MANLPAPLKRAALPRVGQAEVARLQKPGRLPYVGNIPLRRDSEDAPTESLAERQLIDYATTLYQRAGLLPADVHGLDALADLATASVIFITADSEQREVARFTVPARVIDFDPESSPRALPPIGYCEGTAKVSQKPARIRYQDKSNGRSGE